MNFGTRGRLILAASALATTSAVIFAGFGPAVATADAGTVTANGVVLDSAAPDAHTLGPCFTIDATAASGTGSLKIKFDALTPTSGGTLGTDSINPGATKAIDLHNALAAVTTDPAQGYHVRVTVGTKNKGFWIDDATASCPPGTPGVARVNHPPKAASLPATSSTCKTENGFLQHISPAAGGKAKAGTTIGLNFVDESPLDLTSLSFKIDGHAVTPTLNPPSGGRNVRVTYGLPMEMQDGIHTAVVWAKDGDHIEDCGSVAWTFSVSGGKWTFTPPTTTPVVKTTPTTAPPKTTTTTTPVTKPICIVNDQLLGATLNMSTTVIPGSGIGWVYQDADASQLDIVFRVDNQQVTPQLAAQTDGTINIWYMTPQTMASGTHTASIAVASPLGCATASTQFTAASGIWGPT